MSLHVVPTPVAPTAIPAGTPPASIVIRRGSPDAHHEWTARGQQLLRLVSPFLLLGLWEILARTGVLDRRFFPPPSEVVDSALHLVKDGSLFAAAVESLHRLLLGYGIGAVCGIAVGLWLGLSRWSRALIEPWMMITYPIPKLAVYPLLVLIVGLGDLPIIILLAIAVFYIVAMNSLAGVLAIKPVVLDVARDCRASFLQSFWTIALPASLPHIFTGLEVSLGIAYVMLVAAEFVGAKAGLGSIIWSSWQLFDVAPMYVAIVAVSTLGYLSVLGLRAVGSKIMPWRKDHS